MNVKIKYRESIARSLGVSADEIFLFWKGRIAMYALLKSLGIGEGDEVIIPGFTCVVVPNAIIYLGAKPVYVDIDPSTLNMDPDLVAKAITPKTKLIVAQNTFGLPPEILSLQKIAARYNINIIEDCTHGFGGTYHGRPNGTQSLASFFSTQWNKPFSTGIGGFAWCGEKKIIGHMKQMESSATVPSFSERKLLSLLISARKIAGSSSLYWLMLKTYRKLSRMSGFVGSSSGGELSGTEMPDDFLKGISGVQCRKGISEIVKVPAYIEQQRLTAGKYSAVLREMGVVLPDYSPGHTFLKFPLLVKERKSFFDKAEKAGVELGDWFNSPIHPVQKDWEKWQYVKGSCPVAENISAHIVNLPTHHGITTRKFNKIVEFLNNNRNELLSFPV